MTQPAPEGPAVEQTAKVTQADSARAFLQGVTAARGGAGVDASPYPDRSPLAFHWLNGFMQTPQS